MRRLQKCCCCASTRTGTLITGVLGVILAIATIVTIWVVERQYVKFSTFLDKDTEQTLSDYEVPRIIITINLCFTILICALLIVAVQKRRSWLMLPWVVLGIVLAIGLLISVLHTSITFYLSVDEQGEHDSVILATCILVGGLVYLCIYLYLWAVVFSHYLDTRDEEERGRYSKPPYRR